MNLIICDSARRRWEGIVLAAGKDRMRVAFCGASDVTELHREYGQWSLETGEPVDLELLLGDTNSALIRLLEELHPRSFTA